jgi:hypothetical protein
MYAESRMMTSSSGTQEITAYAQGKPTASASLVIERLRHNIVAQQGSHYSAAAKTTPPRQVISCHVLLCRGQSILHHPKMWTDGWLPSQTSLKARQAATDTQLPVCIQLARAAHAAALQLLWDTYWKYKLLSTPATSSCCQLQPSFQL